MKDGMEAQIAKPEFVVNDLQLSQTVGANQGARVVRPDGEVRQGGAFAQRAMDVNPDGADILGRDLYGGEQQSGAEQTQRVAEVVVGL